MRRSPNVRPTAAFAGLLAMALAAQALADTARLRIEAPPGHARVSVTEARLLAGGSVIAQLPFPLLIVGGGSASFGFGVATPPDAVELVYVADTTVAGTATSYAVTPADFGLGTQYFLPAPSPGGSLGPQPGDPELDALFFVSFEPAPPPPADTDPPECELAGRIPDPIQATLQDLESGLASIEVEEALNVDVELPAFAVGTTDPVVVEAEAIDPSRTVIFALAAEDQDGNRVLCKTVQRVRQCGLLGAEGLLLLWPLLRVAQRRRRVAR